MIKFFCGVMGPLLVRLLVLNIRVWGFDSPWLHTTNHLNFGMVFGFGLGRVFPLVLCPYDG